MTRRSLPTPTLHTARLRLRPFDDTDLFGVTGLGMHRVGDEQDTDQAAEAFSTALSSGVNAGISLLFASTVTWAHTATASNAVKGYRIPREPRGSGTRLTASRSPPLFTVGDRRRGRVEPRGCHDQCGDQR
jgi:hypothetical protein